MVSQRLLRAPAHTVHNRRLATYLQRKEGSTGGGRSHCTGGRTPDDVGLCCDLVLKKTPKGVTRKNPLSCLRPRFPATADERRGGSNPPAQLGRRFAH